MKPMSNDMELDKNLRMDAVRRNENRLRAVCATNCLRGLTHATKGKYPLREQIATYHRIRTGVHDGCPRNRRILDGLAIDDGPAHKEAAPGDVSGFDVRTGKLKWTLYNPPR